MQTTNSPAVRPSATPTPMVVPTADQPEAPWVVRAEELEDAAAPQSGEHAVVDADADSEYHPFEPGEDYFELHEAFDSYTDIIDDSDVVAATPAVVPTAAARQNDIMRWALPLGGLAVTLAAGVGLFGFLNGHHDAQHATPGPKPAATAETQAPQAPVQPQPPAPAPVPTLKEPVRQVTQPVQTQGTGQQRGTSPQRARRSVPAPRKRYLPNPIPGLPAIPLP
ncbi:hypothetical protein [Gordonia sp. (in: high G+C Gram-positive bacteria)]|uniref:hypothetical protein n=1 Tax=Gordonia sp. (in: high G+C Gram-positive bacteria) TaxID=84139 RepID=UPI0039E4F942